MIITLVADCYRCRSHDKTLLVTADSAGDIKLFRYPVLSKQVRQYAA